MAFSLTYAVLSYLKLIAVQYFKISSHGANLKCFGCLSHTWKPSSSSLYHGAVEHAKKITQ